MVDSARLNTWDKWTEDFRHGLASVLADLHLTSRAGPGKAIRSAKNMATDPTCVRMKDEGLDRILGDPRHFRARSKKLAIAAKVLHRYADLNGNAVTVVTARKGEPHRFPYALHQMANTLGKGYIVLISNSSPNEALLIRPTFLPNPNRSFEIEHASYQMITRLHYTTAGKVSWSVPSFRYLSAKKLDYIRTSDSNATIAARTELAVEKFLEAVPPRVQTRSTATTSWRP